MPNKDSLGDRMKRYEIVSQHQLIRRMPVIIRLDGKAFHTFTRKITPQMDESLLHGPFSHKLHDIMFETMFNLYGIQNVKLAYTQSDEISLLLTDWENLHTDQWFSGNVQKIVSVSAAIATAAFNYEYARIFHSQTFSYNNIALFDSRVFNLPKEDVTNYILWRQQDTTRNSVQMLGRYYFSHKQLQNKSNNQIQDMLMVEHGINWNELDTWKKRGTCIYKDPTSNEIVFDKNMPIISQHREYVDRFII